MPDRKVLDETPEVKKLSPEVFIVSDKTKTISKKYLEKDTRRTSQMQVSWTW